MELLSSERVLTSPIFDVYAEVARLPSGMTCEVVVLEHHGAAAVVALDSAGRMLCVRQYRHAIGAWSLEIPAGRLEPGEDPATCAARELEEETGLRAQAVQPWFSFHPAIGFCNEHITVFRAEGLESAGADRLAPDADEELEIHWIEPARLVEQTTDSKTLIAAWRLLAKSAGL